MTQFWAGAEPYLRAIAYLVDESHRDNILLIHEHLKKAEVGMAHVVLDYLLAPAADGEPITACPETLQAVLFILSRLNDLTKEELDQLAKALQADCESHVS